MSDPKLCSKCQRPLGSSAPHELCPACLLGAMITEGEGSRLGEPSDETLLVTGPGSARRFDAISTMASALHETAGERIGRYKLLQQIGEGGFGTVWMAEQMEPVTRRVALKIIKLGMDTMEVIARFEAERQALAMMDHPNIAKVFDAGATDNGRPFFVMELVKGIPITAFCDDQQLGTRERLALFGDVCAAINHAHQKGIIHRDIKPSNVMVTLQGDKAVVKVIDFGIAKATQGKLTDKTLFTKFDQFIGTPVYMSPEQAALSGLDIDTRSDIYALGILLYELLIGKPPFDAKSLLSAGYEEMRRIIREVEPAKPSSRLSTVAGDERLTIARARQISPDNLSRLVEPDLDWIVMKAIEKDRTRRYETANGLALDIQRFLSDEPVSATPPSAGYRFRKFARRNKTALRVGSAIAALLVAGIVISTWQALRAIRAEGLATQETERARASLEDANATSKFLTDMFTSSRPGEKKGGRDLKVADVIDRAVEELEANPQIPPARRANLHATLGLTYLTLGLARQAIEPLERARDYCVATLGIENPITLGMMGNLAASYAAAGRRDEALKMGEEVLALMIKVNGPEHPDTLTGMGNLASSYFDAGRRDEALKLSEELLPLSLKVNGPEHPDTLRAMNSLAVSRSAAGQLDDALKKGEELLEFSRKVLGPEHPDTLRAMLTLAPSLCAAGRLDESIKLSEELLPLSLKVNGPEHPDTLTAMNNLATCYSDAGRFDDAITMGEELLTLRHKANGPEHPATLAAMQVQARSYSLVHRMDDAIKMGEELLTLRRKVLGLEHPDTLEAMHNLASSYSNTNREDEALKLNEEVLTLHRKVNGPEHPRTLEAMSNLARSYANTGRLDEGLKLREEVLTLRRRVNGPEHPDTLMAMGKLATSCFQADRRDEALRIQEELLPLSRGANGPEHPDTLSFMAELAISYQVAGRLDEALKLNEETLAVRRRVLGPENSSTLLAMGNLAISYFAAGRRDEALKMGRELLPLMRKVSGPEHPDTLKIMVYLAQFHGEAGHVDEAIKLGEELLALRRKVNGREHPDTLKVMQGLANAYSRTGRKKEAEALRKELIALQPKQKPSPSVADTLVPPDSEWKWLHPTDGVDPAAQQSGFHIAFFRQDFDDAKWTSGTDSADPNGGFGYGLSFTGVSIGKPESMNHRRTAYFRHVFKTDKAHDHLELRCRRDDGIIVYLDGEEVVRDNLPAGPDAYQLSATRAQGPDNDSIVHQFPIPGTLAAGDHILAISVHNTAQASSDLYLGGVTLVETKPAAAAEGK